MPTVIEPKYERESWQEAGRTYYRRGWTVFTHTTATDFKPTPSEVEEIYAAINSTIKVGDPYPGLPGVKCRRVQTIARPDAEIWDVWAEYDIPEEEPEPDSIEEFEESFADFNSPFGPEYTGGSITIDEFWPFDLDGKYFVNGADQPLQNVPPIPIPVQTLSVTFNTLTKPNTSTQGNCQGQYMLARVGYTPQVHTDRNTGVRTKYYQATYEVWKHPYRDWAIVYALNQGTKVWVLSSEPDPLGGPPILSLKLANIVDSNGEPISEPAMLNADGTEILDKNVAPIQIPFRVRNVATLTDIPYIVLD